MAKDVAQAVTEPAAHLGNAVVSQARGRISVAAILDKGNLGVGRAQYVVI